MFKSYTKPVNIGVVPAVPPYTWNWRRGAIPTVPPEYQLDAVFNGSKNRSAARSSATTVQLDEGKVSSWVERPRLILMLVTYSVMSMKFVPPSNTANPSNSLVSKIK